MGVHNSSNTRVVPVFEKLFASDPTGASWLPGLMRMGTRSSVLEGSISVRLVEEHPKTWGTAELSLAAPLCLLEYLVRNISEEQVVSSGDKGEVLNKRRALARRESQTIAEALRALRAGRRGRHWFVLEGDSRPDATLEMTDTVLVVEGKRTERSCTSKTKWMGARSQLVRHMDAALEYFPGKKVLGLLLVEGDGGPEAVMPSQYWIRESEVQYSTQLLSASLPHRTQAERGRIKAGILGVATWQAVCRQNAIPWPPIEDSGE